MKSLLRIAVVVAALMLSACASTESLDYAGTADYHITPVFNAAGDVVAYEARVRNGKEIGHVKLGFRKSADGTMELQLDEEGVKAFEGQAISADAVARMTEALTRAGVQVTPAIVEGIVKALQPGL